jgi:hypothetical protein
MVTRRVSVSVNASAEAFIYLKDVKNAVFEHTTREKTYLIGLVQSDYPADPRSLF